MADNLTLPDKAATYVDQLFKEALSNSHVYHNYNHTVEVVEAAQELAKGEGIENEELALLLIAAWFHDTGYTRTSHDHEAESVNIFCEFAQQEGLANGQQQEVERLILSTKEGHTPQDLPEAVMHDAGKIHIGKKSFDRLSELLRTELEVLQDQYYNEVDWQQRQLDFLISHNFYTRYAQQTYGERRDKNITEQRELLQKAQEKTTKKKTGKNMGRGIDTLYRTTYRNHINLSQIADGKANMMISVNSIILSVIITMAGTGFSISNSTFVANLRYVIPIFLLLLGTLGSVIFAIISARPKVTDAKVTRDDLENRQASITFFGNFVNTTLEEFIGNMDYLKGNQDLLYDNMAIDLYYLGQVLNKKYRLLKVSYNLFMAGLVLSALAFVVIFFYSHL